MAVFPSFKLTEKGEELLNRSIGEGKTLTFTKFELGDGNPPSDFRKQTGLVNKFYEFPILNTSIQKDQVLRIRGYFDNKSFSQDKQLKEIGVFVKIEGNETQYLYSYTNAVDTGDIIPANSRGFYSRTLDVANYIGYATNITFNIEQLRDRYAFNTENEMKVASYLKVGDKVELWGNLVLGDKPTDEYIIQESGEIELSNGLFAKKVSFKYIAQTIEEIQKLALKVGDIVEVLGYYQAGDGAGHKRVIASEDDGSGVQLSNGLWANLIFDKEYNIRKTKLFLRIPFERNSVSGIVIDNEEKNIYILFAYYEGTHIYYKKYNFKGEFIKEVNLPQVLDGESVKYNYAENGQLVNDNGVKKIIITGFKNDVNGIILVNTQDDSIEFIQTPFKVGTKILTSNTDIFGIEVNDDIIREKYKITTLEKLKKGIYYASYSSLANINDKIQSDCLFKNSIFSGTGTGQAYGFRESGITGITQFSMNGEVIDSFRMDIDIFLELLKKHNIDTSVYSKELIVNEGIGVIELGNEIICLSTIVKRNDINAECILTLHCVPDGFNVEGNLELNRNDLITDIKYCSELEFSTLEELCNYMITNKVPYIKRYNSSDKKFIDSNMTTKLVNASLIKLTLSPYGVVFIEISSANENSVIYFKDGNFKFNFDKTLIVSSSSDDFWNEDIKIDCSGYNGVIIHITSFSGDVDKTLDIKNKFINTSNGQEIKIFKSKSGVFNGWKIKGVQTNSLYDTQSFEFGKSEHYNSLTLTSTGGAYFCSSYNIKDLQNELNTPAMQYAMELEGVKQDYLEYSLEKFKYDKQLEAEQQAKYEAYELLLQENPELTWEEFKQQYGNTSMMNLSLVEKIEEPEIPETVKKFMEKYL